MGLQEISNLLSLYSDPDRPSTVQARSPTSQFMYSEQLTQAAIAFVLLLVLLLSGIGEPQQPLPTYTLPYGSIQP
jgi:hypothetical protein